MATLKLECKEQFDSRIVEISCKEDRNLHRTENIVKEYVKTYKFLEPLYYVLNKFFLNTKLSKESENKESGVVCGLYRKA